MTSELRLDGVEVAPGVLETIVTLAAESVDGVACVGTQGLVGVMHKAGRTKGVEVSLSDDGRFSAALHLSTSYGRPLRAIAADVQLAIADALRSQTGNAASTVDVFIDGIVFPE
jgi:uncharacterized alkaline shock family protein YloU